MDFLEHDFRVLKSEWVERGGVRYRVATYRCGWQFWPLGQKKFGLWIVFSWELLDF